jgi:hypothetical protein
MNITKDFTVILTIAFCYPDEWIEKPKNAQNMLDHGMKYIVSADMFIFMGNDRISDTGRSRADRGRIIAGLIIP